MGRKKKAAKNGNDGDEPAKKAVRGCGAKVNAAAAAQPGGTKPGCDEMCPKSDVCGVYVDTESGDPYACVLNQTNISQNNNKFFIVQVLKENDKELFYTWIRWGRVGYAGQTSLTCCGASVEKAVGIFEKKFLDKTKNEWSERKAFEKHPLKYDLVHTELQLDEDEEPDGAANAANKQATKVDGGAPESKLEGAVQELIRMISDVKVMEAMAQEMEFDTKRNPLGKVTAEQIKAGYASLSAIAEVIKSCGGVAVTVPGRRKAACDLSSEFYTRIPHYFGMRMPPPILSMAAVKAKVELLEALGDIKFGMELISKASCGKGGANALDVFYDGLGCDISALPKDSETFEVLEQYIMSTHGKTHSSYAMDVEEIFECAKPSLPFAEDVGNRMLLFHGSRLSNWAGILSQGLRIAPPEAPVTGYMFGKGIYFADMSSKSANYCHASRSNSRGLLLLCEVALGDTNDLVQADCRADKLPKGKRSVKGVGRLVPGAENATQLEGGVVVPLGPARENNDRSDISLNYNEYIVYDPKQVRPRFLAKIKFGF